MRPAFITAFLRSLADFTDAGVLGVLARALGVTIALFIALVVASGWGVAHVLPLLVPADWSPGWSSAGSWLGAGLGGGLALLAGWFGFGVVAMTVSGFMVEAVAAAVERRRYPGSEPPRATGWGQDIVLGVRFLGLVVAANLLALPLLLVPPLGEIAFFAVNGYLMGRQYFEQTALRHLPPPVVRQLYRRTRARIFCGGLIIAFISVLPAVNLVVPVLATAFMLHLYNGFADRGIAGGEGGVARR